VVPCAAWQIDPAMLDTDAIRTAAKEVVRVVTVAQGVASAMYTPSRFQVFDERMHNVTAPRRPIRGVGMRHALA
jgi:hypothetical protein